MNDEEYGALKASLSPTVITDSEQVSSHCAAYIHTYFHTQLLC